MSPTRAFAESAKRKRRQIGGVDLQNGDVGLGIGADDLGLELALVAERDGDLVGAVDHVIIGEQVAVGTHDHAASQAMLGAIAGHVETVAPAARIS